MKTISLNDGASMSALGMGTWFMGDSPELFNQEVDALRRGIELGMTVIDTAEMYGEGRSEKLVGKVIEDCRDQVFLVSKVLPSHASEEALQKACEQSLERLGTDYLDMYLLHWRSGVPMQETVNGLEKLRKDGFIRRWGVSNFDVCDMQELLACDGGNHCQANQVLYHLGSRGVEFDLLPYLNKHKIAMMGYSPLAQAGKLRRELLGCAPLRQVADELDADPFQVMLAWSIRDSNVMTIPKASTIAHIESNAKAAQLQFSQTQLEMLDRAFPTPSHKVPLAFI